MGEVGVRGHSFACGCPTASAQFVGNRPFPMEPCQDPAEDLPTTDVRSSAGLSVQFRRSIRVVRVPHYLGYGSFEVAVKSGSVNFSTSFFFRTV